VPTAKPNQVELWLEQLGQPSADRDYKPGHARMRELLAPLDCTRPKLRIRVAGTNGKGSTSFMLAEALKHSGLRVGLYTSPHILDFSERIRLNGSPVSDATLMLLMEEVMPIALRVGASYFEVATALALAYFSREKVDVEVLEAGVGARLDATTAVEADMGLLTSIGLDHEAWLGSTLLDVAQEKVFVFQGCRYAISTPQSLDIEAFLTQGRTDIQFALPLSESTKMLGAYQKSNAGLAYQAIQTLLKDGWIVGDASSLLASVLQTTVPGRLQHVCYQQANIWLDAAHNRHAIEAMLPFLPELASPLDAILVYTREDRSLKACFPLLRPYTHHLISDVDHAYVDIAIPCVTDALHDVLVRRKLQNILILGSFLTVAAALRWLENNKDG